MGYDAYVDYGDSKRCTVTFRNATGTVADPGIVRFLYIRPGGSIVTLVYGVDADIVRSSTGVYYVDVIFDAEGTWQIRWESATSIVAAIENRIYCKRTSFH